MTDQDNRETPASEVQDPQGTDHGAKIVAIGRDSQAKIGQHLRLMFDAVVKEGIPDQFANLLSELEKKADKQT